MAYQPIMVCPICRRGDGGIDGLDGTLAENFGAWDTGEEPLYLAPVCPDCGYVVGHQQPVPVGANPYGSA